MPIEGYPFGSDSFAELLIAKHFPERADHETALLKDYLRAHLTEYDGVMFSVRIGRGADIDPSLLPAVQRALERSTKRRIDMIAWKGEQYTLVEAKTKIGHEVLGQLISDRQLWLEEFPDGPEPRLVAVGRGGAADDIRVLNSHGITVYLYEPAPAQ